MCGDRKAQISFSPNQRLHSVQYSADCSSLLLQSIHAMTVGFHAQSLAIELLSRFKNLRYFVACQRMNALSCVQANIR